MFTLRKRNRQPELMDDPLLPAAVHRQALSGLARVNRMSRTVSQLWKAMKPFVHDRHIRVVDIGSGGGDVLCGLAAQASKEQIDFEGVGCDISSTACAHARQLADSTLPRPVAERLTFEQKDCFDGELSGGFDVAFCSLFLHHLDDLQAVRLLERMRRLAERAVVVDDLVRSPSGYVMAWLGTRLISRSRIVHVDGPLSVRAAFTLSEVSELARQAGCVDPSIKLHWPHRFLMVWTNHAA